MFVHDLNPVFIQIGFLEIRWYGILYALGFLFLFFFLHHVAKKKHIINFTKEDVEPFLIGLIISVVLGARLFHTMIYEPTIYFADPLRILFIFEGGLSFHGALTFSALWIFYFCKKKHIPFFQLTDYIVLPAAFFLALGRMANFVNAELVGKVTNVSWAVDFSKSNPLYEGFRHPTQLYEGAKNLFLFTILIILNIYRRSVLKKMPFGIITIIFLLFYGVFRFFIEFLKESGTILLGLNMGQILSVGMLLLAGYLLFVIFKTKKEIEKNASPKNDAAISKSNSHSLQNNSQNNNASFKKHSSKKKKRKNK